ERRLKRSGRKMNESNQKQALIPRGSEVLPNKEGTAPGVAWKIKGCQLYFLPGVPREFTYLLDRFVLPRLKKEARGVGDHLFILKVFGWPESELNELMKRVSVPEGVTVGFRTHLPENHLKFLVKAPTRAIAQKKLRPLFKELREE